MEILHQEPIMEMASNYSTAAFVVMAIGLVSFAIFMFSDALSFGTPIGGIGVIISIIVLAVIVVKAPVVETGRYKYTALIDEDTPFVEIYEKYEVIDMNGKVWTLEDREVEE
jgi:membrane protein implicated in regulation of membrane protease activity